MSNKDLPSEMGRGMSEKVRRQINGYVEHAPRDIEFTRDPLELVSNVIELEHSIYHIVDSLDLPIPRSSDKRHLMWEERILLAKRFKDIIDSGYQTVMPQMKWGRVDIIGIVERSRYNLC